MIEPTFRKTENVGSSYFLGLCLIDNVEHLRHFTIVKLESWTNNEKENFIIAQMNQRTNTTHNKSKDSKRNHLTIYFAICIISISIFPQSSLEPEAYWSITSETRQIRILGRPNINANLHASIFFCCSITWKGLSSWKSLKSNNCSIKKEKKRIKSTASGFVKLLATIFCLGCTDHVIITFLNT